jgi:hypothetical protein
MGEGGWATAPSLVFLILPLKTISIVLLAALSKELAFLLEASPHDIDILIGAFLAYISPVVQNNSVEWNPCSVCLNDLLEGVHRSFT